MLWVKLPLVPPTSIWTLVPVLATPLLVQFPAVDLKWGAGGAAVNDASD